MPLKRNLVNPLLTLTASGAAVNGADQTNENNSGVVVVVDITAVSGTSPTLTVTIQGKDPISGKYYTILASSALASVATTVLRVFPGSTVTANLAANDVLPNTWRVITAIGGSATPTVTGTVSALLV